MSRYDILEKGAKSGVYGDLIAIELDTLTTDEKTARSTSDGYKKLNLSIKARDEDHAIECYKSGNYMGSSSNKKAVSYRYGIAIVVANVISILGSVVIVGGIFAACFIIGYSGDVLLATPYLILIAGVIFVALGQIIHVLVDIAKSTRELIKNRQY